MTIEPRITNGASQHFQKKILTVIVNMFGVGDLYPDEVVEKWIENEVLSPHGAWGDMVEDSIIEWIISSSPGDLIWDAMETRIESYKRRPE